MADAENKNPDFVSSIALGSAEGYDHSCDPCLTTGQQIKAHGYCVDCREHLCKVCFSARQRIKVLKHHQLLDKDSIEKHGIPRTSPEAFTERCSEHKDEVIKFFCHQHEELGCHDCIILYHRSCKIDYIPNKCTGIEDSDEYRETEWLLEMKMKDIEYIAEKAADRDAKIDASNNDLMKDIDTFEEEMVNHIHRMSINIKAEADKKKQLDKQIVKGVLDSCTHFSTEISQLQSSLQESKRSGHSGQTYIEIKRAMTKLKSVDIKKSEDDLAKTVTQFRFCSNEDLKKMLSRQEAVLGRLTLTRPVVDPLMKIEAVIHKHDIDITSDLDEMECRITGCTFLANNIVLVDNSNDIIKICDMQTKLMIVDKYFDYISFDITSLPNNQIAVTASYSKEILIITSTDGDLTLVRTIPTPGFCFGITYFQKYLYVVCACPYSISILDKEGHVHKTISLNNNVFKDPCNIVVSEKSRLIYITDRKSKVIVGMNHAGEIKAIIKDIPEPRGLTLLPDGSLLVCSKSGGTVHQVTGDLGQHWQVKDGLRLPESVNYNHQLKEIYVGCEEAHLLQVYTVKNL